MFTWYLAYTTNVYGESVQKGCDLDFLFEKILITPWRRRTTATWCSARPPGGAPGAFRAKTAQRRIRPRGASMTAVFNNLSAMV